MERKTFLIGKKYVYVLSIQTPKRVGGHLMIKRGFGCVYSFRFQVGSDLIRKVSV